jgi:hypothetical protein
MSSSSRLINNPSQLAQDHVAYQFTLNVALLEARLNNAIPPLCIESLRLQLGAKNPCNVMYNQPRRGISSAFLRWKSTAEVLSN